MSQPDEPNPVEKMILSIAGDSIAHRLLLTFIIARTASTGRSKIEAEKWVEDLKIDVEEFLTNRLTSSNYSAEIFPVMRREINSILNSISFD